MANKLYKEHYTVVPTRHEITRDTKSQKVNFEWLLNKKWNSIYVEATVASKVMKSPSLEKFIFEHYYGYTKIDENNTEAYKLQHPSWRVNQVLEYKICLVCNKPFTWRKKWEKVWDEVKYCSDKCRSNK